MRILFQIEALEVKVAKEKVDLVAKLKKMEEEYENFKNIGGLRNRMEQKRKKLAQEKDELEANRNAVAESAKEIANAKALIKVGYQSSNYKLYYLKFLPLILVEAYPIYSYLLFV